MPSGWKKRAFPLGLGLTRIWLDVTIDYFVRAALLAPRIRSGAWAKVSCDQNGVGAKGGS